MEVTGPVTIAVSPVESLISRRVGQLCRCQELTHSPVEQPERCDDVQSYCI